MDVHIPLWLLYVLGAVGVYFLIPNVTRNHDGDTLVLWMRRRWLKHNGKWEEV